jgi:hypothetical protein
MWGSNSLHRFLKEDSSEKHTNNVKSIKVVAIYVGSKLFMLYIPSVVINSL